MNKVTSNIYDTRKILVGLLVSALSIAGCTNQFAEPEYGTDGLSRLPAETPISLNANITKAGESTLYAYNEIHELTETDYKLFMPGSTGSVNISGVYEGISGFVNSLDLHVYDFNLSTAKHSDGVKVVSRWTQLEVENGADQLIAATRLSVDENTENPVLDYNLEHAGTRVSVTLRESANSTGTGKSRLMDYRDGLSVEINHQTSRADYFLNGKRLINLASANTTDPDDTDIQSYEMCTYKSGEGYMTTELEVPVLADGTPSEQPYALFSAILPATPMYEYNQETGEVTELVSPGFTDEDYIVVTVDDVYVDGHYNNITSGGTYKIRLSDIYTELYSGTKLTSLEPGKHLSITLEIDFNNKVQATAEVCDWDEADADGNLYGDYAYLATYTVSEDGKTYTVNQPDGLYAWAKALNESETKDINLILGADIPMPEMVEGKSNWNLVGISKDNPYVGTIDGQGHKIENLIILDQNSTYFGFIPVLGEDGVIRNLTIKDVRLGSYTTTEYVGLLAAYNYGTITGCHSSGSFTDASETNRFGGIAGQNDGAIINCTNRCAIASNGAGGIVHTNNRYVFGCVNYASITGTASTDGVGGIAATNSKDIVGCANRGTITFDDVTKVGSLAGVNSGKVIGSWTSVGEILVGSTLNLGVTTECYCFTTPNAYFDDMINEINKSIKSYNQTNGDRLDALFGWNIAVSDKWLEIVDFENALLKTDYEMSADGTTMTVYTYGGLYEWANMVNGNEQNVGKKTLGLILGKDILLPPAMTERGNWTPVCYQSNGTYNYYKGVIDGQGHKIIGMTIIRPTSTTGYDNSDIGFVSLLGEGGKISNIIFEDATVQGTNGVAVIAGEIANSTIEACLVTGNSSVTGTLNVGSIVGVCGKQAESTTGNSFVIACGSLASVSGNNTNSNGTGTTIGCWSTDTDDFGKNYGSIADRIVGCVAGDAVTINAEVQTMNTALETKGSQWRWIAGSDDALPTLSNGN